MEPWTTVLMTHCGGAHAYQVASLDQPAETSGACVPSAGGLGPQPGHDWKRDIVHGQGGLPRLCLPLGVSVQDVNGSLLTDNEHFEHVCKCLCLTVPRGNILFNGMRVTI